MYHPCGARFARPIIALSCLHLYKFTKCLGQWAAVMHFIHVSIRTLAALSKPPNVHVCGFISFKSA